MAISLNSKQNIGFSGLKQNIEQSRQIVASLRKEIGRPKSCTFVSTRILQHQDDPKYADICERLELIEEKYETEVSKARDKVANWEDLMKTWYEFREYLPLVTQNKTLNLHQYINKMKNTILKAGAANCGEMADLVQYEHLTKGIKTHNVGVKFYDKAEPFYEEDNYLRDHCFSVRGLAKNAELSEPHTWGQNAVIVDSWIGTGMVEKAFDTPIPTYKNGQKVRGEFIQGGISKILDFFKFNPDTEKLRFFDDNLNYSREFIDNMRAKGK